MTTPLSTAPDTTDDAEIVVDAEVAVDPDACDVCQHGQDRHDRVAQRFCRATLAGALSRGCICAKAR